MSRHTPGGGRQNPAAAASAPVLTSATGQLPSVANLPGGIIKRYTGTGRASAGAITATGAKVGDKVVEVMGFVTSTGVLASIDASGSFESTVTVADQIQQTGSSLGANTYRFLVQARS